MPTITLTDPVTNTTVASGLIATNNANLRSLLNSGIDAVNLKGAPALVAGEFPVWDGTNFVRSSTISTGFTPVGAIVQYGAATAPANWALCDGSSQLRADANYAALYAIIGTTYGFADGTHFNLPDLRGRIPVGFATAGGHADVSTLNNNDAQAVANRRPKHRTTNALSHNLTLPDHTHNYTAATAATLAQPGVATPGATPTATVTGGVNSTPAINGGITGSIGTNVANDALDTPSYIVVNYIIKL